MNTTIPEIKNKLSELDILLILADYLIQYQQTLLQQLKAKMNVHNKDYPYISNSEIYYENYLKQKANLK